MAEIVDRAVGSTCCLDTADVIERWQSMEAILQRAVSVPPFPKGVGGISQVANGKHLPSSFGLRVRDRAARLRSSDVLEKGIPDAKNRDVVAVQLLLFELREPGRGKQV